MAGSVIPARTAENAAEPDNSFNFLSLVFKNTPSALHQPEPCY